MKQSIYKPFLFFLIILFMIGLLLWYSSPFSKLNWGEWNLYYHQMFLPILVVSLVILGVFVFQREIQLAKTEQREKDCRNFIRILKLEKEQLQELIKQYGATEEKINAIWEEIKDKINLSKLNDLPELAITLIEKIINIKDEYGVKLHTHISGDISYLRNIRSEDLRQTIELMLTPICSNFINIPIEDRHDINIFIREHQNKIIFKVMHDYMSETISTEMIEWNVKKILYKYGGNFIVTNEQEEESDNMFVLSLTMELPKEKVKKII